MNFQPVSVLRRMAVLLCCVAVASAIQTAANQEEQAEAALPKDPNQYVREVIKHELACQDSDHTHWRYHLHREDEKGSSDRDVIQTREGQLSRTLLINGRPLTADQRQKDEDRMRKQVSDPGERAKREKREKDDGDKAEQMLKAIPDAFIFKYDGFDHGLVGLSFFPNPHYDAPNREMQVFRSLSGKMWIDPKARRLARIDGTLFEDVTFGWGLLGRLNKGGTFNVVQKDVGDNHWDIVSMDVNMTGHAVIFKSINVKQRQVLSDFRRVPDTLTISQAYELLERGEGAVSANNEPAAGKPQGNR
jgi:hypothetical protein